MASKARKSLSDRLKDVDQLLNAHAAITKFKSAEKAATKVGGALGEISRVIDALVKDPGPGKPKEVDAINRAAFVLLIAHFQGFVDELHEEVGVWVLDGRASDPAAIIKLVRVQRSNPHVDVIDKMFAGLGIYDLMSVISWQKCTNKSVKERLKTYIETRNKVAHGKKEPITKAKVVQLKRFVELLADALDSRVQEKAKTLTGKMPW